MELKYDNWTDQWRNKSTSPWPCCWGNSVADTSDELGERCMRRVAVLLGLIFALFTGCDEQSQSTPLTVIENETPAIGTDGKLTQSIGLETLGGVFTPLLFEGTAVPCTVSKIFSTAADNQEQIMLTLYRGNAEMVSECEYLGQFQVVDITPAPRGKPQIEITFAVKRGDVLLSAKDLTTGKAMKIIKTEGPSDASSAR